MKTLQQTSLSSAFTLVFMSFACFSCNIAIAQNALGSDGQKSDSAETLVALHTPISKAAKEDGKTVNPKFDTNIAYQDIQAYLIDEVGFPTEGIEAGRSGMMKVRFQIMTDGSMQHIQFIESPGAHFESQVQEALKKAPKWTPAKKDGKNVPITYQLNINFKLR